jgi:3-oxoacyl-[acyl-carrier-protein] synthase-3
LGPEALVFSLNQGCNGAFVAMKVASRHLLSEPGGSILITGADRFEATLFDRWSSDHGTIYGDAAAAVVVSGREGPFRILCLEVEQGSDLEQMYREATPGPEHDGSARLDYDVGAAKRAYLAENGTSQIETVFATTLGRLREKLLKAFPLDEQPASRVVYPNVGAGISAGFYVRAFGDLAREDGWAFGRSIGHTGVSDQIVGLVHLLRTGELQPGERVLLVGAGNGLSAAVMLVELVGSP